MIGRVSEDGMRKAKRALSAFRSLQPTLNAYARMLTGKPTVQVVESAHSNGSTDGDKIYYRPPIDLGLELPHQKWNCGKRDEDDIKICPACAQRESILVTIYHEIAHIWFDSFQKVSDDRKAEALRTMVSRHGSKYAAEIEQKINRAPYYVRSDYMALAGLISGFLPKIINALEDARVNSHLFQAMPGTKVMFDADTRVIFDKGVEQVDEGGNWVHMKWSDYTLNAQVICGLFCQASGYDYGDWFHTDVVAALADKQLTELIDQGRLAKSMADVFGLSFTILARLRELGFCRLDTDPEVQEDPEPEDEGQPEDGDTDEEPEPGPSSDGEPGDEEQGEEAEPTPGDSDGTEGESEPEAAGGSGEDQQEDGDETPDGGESTGEDNADDERDSTPSESESGEPGDVDEHSEGSSADDQEAEGSSGGADQDDHSDVPDGGDVQPDGRDDPSGGEDVGEELPGSDEDRTGDPTPAPGDDTGQSPDPAAEGTGQQGTGDTTGDVHDDLGGPEGLDSTGSPDLQPNRESDSDAERADGGGGEDGEERDAVLDTGPFTTGTRVLEPETPSEPRPEMGTPEDCDIALVKLGDHEPPGTVHAHQADEDTEAMRTAIIQGVWFETPSANVMGVQHYHFPEAFYDRRPHEFTKEELQRMTGEGWYYGWSSHQTEDYEYLGIIAGQGDTFDAPESVIAKAMLKARLAFSDNLRGKHVGNLRSGKVNGRALGKRAPVGDDRLFQKKLRPSKKSYFVLIGIDISYSTAGENILLAKKLAMAECEMLSRLGVAFAVYAHSGGRLNEGDPLSETGLSGLHMFVYDIKAPDEPWTDRTRFKLQSLGPDTANLDGHQFEYYRRILDRRKETTKILHYYTDGAMPAENKDEELVVLQRELRTLKQRKYVVLGVGIRTDSPRQHGLETAELLAVEDISKVIAHLERELTRQ